MAQAAKKGNITAGGFGFGREVALLLAGDEARVEV